MRSRGGGGGGGGGGYNSATAQHKVWLSVANTGHIPLKAGPLRDLHISVTVVNIHDIQHDMQLSSFPRTIRFMRPTMSSIYGSCTAQTAEE